MVTNLTIISSLEPFLSKPTEKLHLSSIAREIRQPHPTVRLWLNRLEHEGVLKMEFKGRLTLYQLNREHPLLREYLTIAEKMKLIKECNKDLFLREFISLLNTLLPEKINAILFGSAVQAVKFADDIDLLLVGNYKKIDIHTLSRRLHKEIHLINVVSLEKISKTLKEEIIKKHLIIQGTEEVLTWMLKS